MTRSFSANASFIVQASRYTARTARLTPALEWASALRCVTHSPRHPDLAHQLTPRAHNLLPQNQKEGLRKPKSGNSKPPDGLQGVAMAKGKSMPHSHSNPGQLARLLHSRATPGRGEGKATCDAGCGTGQGGKRLQEHQECQPEKECEEDDVCALSASPRRIFGRAGALRGGVSRGTTRWIRWRLGGPGVWSLSLLQALKRAPCPGRYARCGMRTSMRTHRSFKCE